MIFSRGGFTLVEILVTLTVLAAVLNVATGALRASARDAAELEQRLYAHWVASNALAEAMLAPPPPDAPVSRAWDEAYMRHSFRVSAVTRAIPETKLLQTSVEVVGTQGSESGFATLVQRYAAP